LERGNGQFSRVKGFAFDAISSHSLPAVAGHMRAKP
jgi:hypothetical protein